MAGLFSIAHAISANPAACRPLRGEGRPEYYGRLFAQRLFA
jgi:hypothetical protein